MSWARCLAITLTSVCYSMSAIGQNATSPSTAENNESKPIEQITIIGKKPILTLFNQLEAAKIDLYSQYNEFNNIEKYNVECRKSNWTHTRIQEQICWPKFATDLVAKNFQDSFRGIAGVNGISMADIETQYADEFDKLRANILKVATENPGVAAWVLEVGKIEREISEREKECLEDPAFQVLFLRLCGR